jgi:hypothetical protein
MAGLLGHKALTDGLFQHVLQAEKGMMADVEEAALEAGVAGLEAARWTIDNTPSSLSPGKPNRNWTFQMNQALDVDVRRNGNTTTIRVGWLRIKEKYFLIQNDGGNLGEKVITPMNALMNGQHAIKDTLKGWGIKVQ